MLNKSKEEADIKENDFKYLKEDNILDISII